MTQTVFCFCFQHPNCPNDHVTLWHGYSLLHTEDEGRAYVQDLGTF